MATTMPTKGAQRRGWFFSAAAFLLIFAALTVPKAVDRITGDDEPTPTTIPEGPVLVGDHDTEPPVVNGGAGSWEELFGKVGNNPAYWSCFTQRTGHSKEEALVALAREREGWNTQVAIFSNVDVMTGSQAVDSKGLPRDPDVVSWAGFSNTRGAGEGGCEGFWDTRSQVRNALTLPGPDANTPGLPVVLSHCGNPIGYEQPPVVAPPAPSKGQPTVTPAKPGKPGRPSTTVPHTVPPTVPPTAPPTTWKCEGRGDPCGSGGNNAPSHIDTSPLPPTPGYTPGGAESSATDTTGGGVFIPPGGNMSSGGSTGSNGSATGGTTGFGNIAPTEATEQPTNVGMPDHPA